MKKSIGTFLLIIIIFVLTVPSSFAAKSPSIGITGKGAILMEQNTGKVLYGKNIDQRMYPASTTKIMTALVALEYGDLKEIVTIGEEITSIPWDSSKADLFVGQKISLEELLYGLLLPSGNDAAMSIAMYIANKTVNEDLTKQEAIRVFSELMNKKAKELGAHNTHYVNPHGYHDENHYTTPRDMAIISREAMKNELFRKIVQSPRYHYEGNTDVVGKEDLWLNSNEFLHEDNRHYYSYVNGIKTGRTSQAGRCLVSSIKKEDLQLIAIVLNSTEEDIWRDSKKLLSYGLDTFAYHTFAKKGESITGIKVEKARRGDGDKVHLITEGKIQSFLKQEEIPKVTEQVYIGKGKPFAILQDHENINLTAPIEKGETLGYIVYSLNGKVIVKERLVAQESIRKKSFLVSYWWMLLLIIFIVLIIRKKKKIKKRRKRRVSM